MNKKLFIFLQHTLPQHLLSQFAGWVAGCRLVWIKNWIISRFIRRYQVDLSLALHEDLNAYPDFNAFFTRALKDSARPISTAKESIVSPVDGRISQLGRIEKSTLLQAKGSYYTLADLLGQQKAGLPSFEDGQFATFYLSPKDYHRVHLPFPGTLTHTIYIPGKLFSVNPLATEKIPKLFARNERLVCIFDTAIGPMAVILIGAMLVGKIETIWGLIERSSHIITRRYSTEENIQLAKGAELGRFLMGSSVIVLFGKDKMAWLPEWQEQASVKMGEVLGSCIQTKGPL